MNSGTDHSVPEIFYSVGSLGWESWWQRKNLVVWAVDADGIFVGNVPVRYEDGCACITLGKKSLSIYYLIQGE